MDDESGEWMKLVEEVPLVGLDTNGIYRSRLRKVLP